MTTDRTSELDSLLAQIDMTRLPRHVAMIMDGNGRWARQRGLARSEGHAEGVGSVRAVTEFSSDMGIRYLTLYAFSTENWNRPTEEVKALMHLISWAIERELPDLIRNNVRIHLFGDIERIPETARKKLIDCAAATSGCTGLNLGMCLSYSGRDELIRATRELAELSARGELSPTHIDSVAISSRLATVPFPDPDLLIRTGGEQRISNFLLWQIAYTELYFTPALWPDFGKEAYARAIIDYQSREHRFGKTSEQISHVQ